MLKPAYHNAHLIKLYSVSLLEMLSHETQNPVWHRGPWVEFSPSSFTVHRWQVIYCNIQLVQVHVHCLTISHKQINYSWPHSKDILQSLHFLSYNLICIQILFVWRKTPIVRWLNNFRDYNTLEKAVILEIDSKGELLLHLRLYLENVNGQESTGKYK